MKKILFIIVIIIFILFLIYKDFKIELFNSKYNEPKLTELLNNTAKLLNDNNIIFWLDQGTLLGAIRENDFIKHDTDMDISISKINSDKLHKILNNKKILQKYKLKLVRDRNEGPIFSLKLIDSISTNKKDRFKNFDYIDIYILDYRPKLEKKHFKNRYYNVPINSELYLSLVYGSNWKTPISNGSANENLWRYGFLKTDYSKYILK